MDSFPTSNTAPEEEQEESRSDQEATSSSNSNRAMIPIAPTPIQPGSQSCLVSIPLSSIGENLLQQILFGRQPPVFEDHQAQEAIEYNSSSSERSQSEDSYEGSSTFNYSGNLRSVATQTGEEVDIEISSDEDDDPNLVSVYSNGGCIRR